MLRTALTVTIHFIVCIIIQLSFSVHIAFAYDYAIKDLIIWGIISISLIICEYLIFNCGFLTGKTPWIIHSIDLILLIPNIVFIVYYNIYRILYRETIKPNYSIYEIALIIEVILVDVFLILERVKLIKHAR